MTQMINNIENNKEYCLNCNKETNENITFNHEPICMTCYQNYIKWYPFQLKDKHTIENSLESMGYAEIMKDEYLSSDNQQCIPIFMTNSQTIYFSHPTSDYTEEFESEHIKKIKEEYIHAKIINPRTDIQIASYDKKKLSGSYEDYIEMMEKYFFPAIDSCDIVVVCASDYLHYPDGVLKEIQYAKLHDKPVKEWWKKDRMKFYVESGSLDFINNFFDVKKGVRCVAGHEKDMYRLRHEPTYRLWENGKCRAYTVPDITGKYNPLIDYWCLHSYIHTFDKSVLEWNDAELSKSMYKSNKVGLNAIIELDGPDDPKSSKAKRLDFFNYINDFDAAIKKIIDVLEEISEEATRKTGEKYTINYNLQFSGNGIYFILEGYYDDNLLTDGGYRDNFRNLLDRLKEKEGLGDKTKVHVCNSKAPWNKYFKIPFTFHEFRNRISIPLPKGKLDRKWIDRVSNADNVMKDFSIIKEIINKAKWKKLW